MEETGEGRETILRRLKPYLICIFYSFCNAVFNIISKVCLDKGMSRYVLVAYGCAIGTATTSVLAPLFERNNEHKISKPVCLNVFFLGLIGVIGRTFLYAGLECTSPTFAAAMNNLIPSFTFILAIFFRLEKLNLAKLGGQAKIGGTIVALGGATFMTLYKGPTVISLHEVHSHLHATSKVSLDRNLIKGSLFLLLQNLSAATFYILQTTTVRKYPVPMTITSLSGLFGTVIAVTTAAILDHKASSWRLYWDITLVAPLYSGVMIFGITTYLQTVVARSMSPVFTSAFRPLITVIVAIMGLLILGEALHLGGIIGATVIIIGLYAILWGKAEEKKSKLAVGLPPPDPKVEIKLENK